jgi:hypothetical protein
LLHHLMRGDAELGGCLEWQILKSQYSTQVYMLYTCTNKSHDRD